MTWNMGVEVGEECARIKDLGVISVPVIAAFMIGMRIPWEIVEQLDEELQNLKAKQQERMSEESKESNVRKF